MDTPGVPDWNTRRAVRLPRGISNLERPDNKPIFSVFVHGYMETRQTSSSHLHQSHNAVIRSKAASHSEAGPRRRVWELVARHVLVHVALFVGLCFSVGH